VLDADLLWCGDALLFAQLVILATSASPAGNPDGFSVVPSLSSRSASLLRSDLTVCARTLLRSAISSVAARRPRGRSGWERFLAVVLPWAEALTWKSDISPPVPPELNNRWGTIGRQWACQHGRHVGFRHHVRRSGRLPRPVADKPAPGGIRTPVPATWSTSSGTSSSTHPHRRHLRASWGRPGRRGDRRHDGAAAIPQGADRDAGARRDLQIMYRYGYCIGWQHTVSLAGVPLLLLAGSRW